MGEGPRNRWTRYQREGASKPKEEKKVERQEEMGQQEEMEEEEEQLKCLTLDSLRLRTDKRQFCTSDIKSSLRCFTFHEGWFSQTRSSTIALFSDRFIVPSYQVFHLLLNSKKQTSWKKKRESQFYYSV